MRATLNAILKLSTNNEGGYSNHPKDPGGPTNHGITLATLRAFRGSATIADVKALTLDQANQIYIENYWKPIWGDQLPSGLDYSMFDFGINSGVSRAVKELQKLLPGCAVDGVMGRKTINLVLAQDVADLVKKLNHARMSYLIGLNNFKYFGRGWTYRVTGRDPKGQYRVRPGVAGDSLAMIEKKPVRLLPFPLDDVLMPLAKGRDVDIGITTPLGNQFNIGAILATLGGGVTTALPNLLPQLTQAKDAIETVKDVSQFFTYMFAALVVLCAVLALIHGTKVARQSGLNT